LSLSIKVLAERFALIKLAPSAVQLFMDEVHWVEHTEAAKKQQSTTPEEETAQAKAPTKAQLFA
jgi:hypothetical protein